MPILVQPTWYLCLDPCPSVLNHSYAFCNGLAGAGQSAVSAVKAARKACLNTTFSMLDRDSFGPEQGDLSNLQKVC